ncbi:uncharacterized protein LACBIDRAFT_314836 [Laccaria bicolor S238N-H82]|uniref:Predicted protein n=1 Tax=Laccaria bicolor (strain S238N-H82 / ATCC MYA-4686) TaxID=486041 RepID=B0DZB9_LACBS|nr:uncharacterized protein LACBIDRAFT_314836 [Laccaria bicolor S238N-H82]EDR00093.1 predicted protein [Laccaria bicolor S238N-H82]|eukprot:XP_001889299.1 predicted protein [Laccaria bicolor S238N-H82]
MCGPFNPLPMSIESPISGPSPLTTIVSEELPNSDLSQLEYKPQVPTPSSEIFKNQDLLGVVLEFLEHDEFLVATRKNLLLAALTSKAFLEPAMNSLWSSLDSLAPLLKLLPSFVPIDNVYIFTGVIAKGHWERFDYYARRVKFLDSLTYRAGNNSITVSDYAYLRIAQARLSHSSSPLFPALRRLRIPDILIPPSNILSAAFLVSSPSLESVELHSQATSDPHFFASYLSFLVAELAPTLRCLILRGNPRTESLTLLRHLRNIRTLEIRFPELIFSPDLFGTLASLEYLSDLILDSAPPLISPLRKKIMGIARATSGVPLLKLDQLNNLQITGSPTALYHVLGQLHALRLKSMVVKIRGEKTGEPCPFTPLSSECFKCISRSPSLSSIRISETENYSVFLTISNIRPILALSQLEELDISVYSMTGGDKVIQELSSNLPILKTLILPSKWNQLGSLPKHPTFRSLGILADNCPDLIQLKLAIDPLAYLPSFRNKTAAVRQRSHPLKTLYIADANPNGKPLTTTQLVAISRYTDQIFPNLELVGHYGSGNKFKTVDKVRGAFQAVRRDICGCFVEKTAQPSYVSQGTQPSYVSQATQTTYIPVWPGIPILHEGNR